MCSGRLAVWHRCGSLRWRGLAAGRALVHSHRRGGCLVAWCASIVEGGLADGTLVARGGSLDGCVGQTWPSGQTLPAYLTCRKEDESPLNGGTEEP